MISTHEDLFAKGMYVALWPKVEKCHNYVSILLAAQSRLQETVSQLIATLKEAETADSSSLVGYAERLKDFPNRVEIIQRKLEVIEDRLKAIRRGDSSSRSNRINGEVNSLHSISPLF